jgi:hypothetical protein
MLLQLREELCPIQGQLSLAGLSVASGGLGATSAAADDVRLVDGVGVIAFWTLRESVSNDGRIEYMMTM